MNAQHRFENKRWGTTMSITNAFRSAAIIAIAILAGPNLAAAATEEPIHSFTGGKDGAFPTAPLLVQQDGVIFGVTTNGGTAGEGQVFTLQPPAAGSTTWSKIVIWSFGGSTDGNGPRGKLVAGPNGSLFGTTQLGGNSTESPCSGSIGCGTVFELLPPPAGSTTWTKTLLYSFNLADGEEPLGLVADASGALYGTTLTTVFQLAPPAGGSGNWTFTELHGYSGGVDGSGPNPDLLIDSGGVIYGSTPDGGSFGHGTVFSITPPAGGVGTWSYLHLHDFEGPPNDGGAPNGGLQGGAGDLWGTTQGGGTDSGGSIFELRQEIEGSPLYTAIQQYSFSGTGSDGGIPLAGLFRADDGSYWGTASQGGVVDATYCSNGCGVVFQLTRKLVHLQLVWEYAVVSDFDGTASADGLYPNTALGADHNGSLYGMTLDGGDTFGTVFELADAAAILPAATPVFSPAGGNYTTAQTVMITDSTPGATIYYTTDGTTPTKSSSVYSEAITVSSTEKLKADAMATGYLRSAVASATYTIEPRAATPVFSPKGGTYSAAKMVKISDATPGATIYYTTDGTKPTKSSSVYTGPITVSSTEKLKAEALATGYLWSSLASATYTIDPPGAVH
jgi:hypothetical protein